MDENLADIQNNESTIETIGTSLHANGMKQPETILFTPSPEKTIETHSNSDLSNLVSINNSINNPANLNNLENEENLNNYLHQISQLNAILDQKNNLISLYDREKLILEKEKCSLKKESEAAMKEKESIVIRFATKEKILLDSKKQTENVEKLLNDSKKEIKNITIKYQTLNEEKSRISYMLEEKCNELKKQQKETEKYKTDVNNLELKLKWNNVKLNQEIENKLNAEKKLEEERLGPKVEGKEIEKKRIEYEASMILLKHEVANKEKLLGNALKDYKVATEKINNLQEALTKEINEKTNCLTTLENLKTDHAAVQNSLSNEMLNSAKLRGQLEDLNVLQTRDVLNEEEIYSLNSKIKELQEELDETSEDIKLLRGKETELMSLNKELSELNVDLQNQTLLLTSQATALLAENELIKKDKLQFDMKFDEIKTKLNKEIEQKNEERNILTKHLCEKTKLYESVKIKLENALGDLEATKKKHTQIFKELNREIHKYKNQKDTNSYLKSKEIPSSDSQSSREDLSQEHQICGVSSNHQSDSESDLQSNSSIAKQTAMEPSTQHLVNRILRLQQSSARQTEKIDFLENHTMSLVAELQKKSKLIQYYMLRDQIGALTSSKSDENKTELAKYGGVMSAIYSGITGTNQTSMTLPLSLEINKKLQAVLEDTLLKNITLKENLDVLGLEVDKLTRELAEKHRK